MEVCINSWVVWAGIARGVNELGLVLHRIYITIITRACSLLCVKKMRGNGGSSTSCKYIKTDLKTWLGRRVTRPHFPLLIWRRLRPHILSQRKLGIGCTHNLEVIEFKSQEHSLSKLILNQFETRPIAVFILCPRLNRFVISI